MEVRTQTASPCERKGDSVKLTRPCECMTPCLKLKGFLRPISKGTIHHQNAQASEFEGCLPLEESLIKDRLIRYETREDGGLEVLFDGLEYTQNLNGEIFNDDIPTSLASHFEVVGDFLTDARDNDRNLKRASYTDKDIRDFLPQTLDFAQSGLSAFASPPENLRESFFETMYARGDFANESDDMESLATCLFYGIDDPKTIKKIWPRFTEKRHQETIAKIWAKVFKEMPFWARRFNQLWDKLTEAQAEALKAEWFYEDEEKPTQEVIAKNLGISVASYQERLEWAIKKLERLYPEFTRLPRKKPKSNDNSDEEKLPPEALYKILPSGERVQIELPTKKNRVISQKEYVEIKRWAFSSTTSYLFSQNFYTDVQDPEDEAEQEQVDEEIEKEHEDYLKIKATLESKR